MARFKIISETLFFGKTAKVGDIVTIDSIDLMHQLRSAGRIGADPEPEPKAKPAAKAEEAKPEAVKETASQKK